MLEINQNKALIIAKKLKNEILQNYTLKNKTYRIIMLDFFYIRLL